MIPRPAQAHPPSVAVQQPDSILVVDDDQVVRVLLRELLLAEGYAVSEAGTAEQAERQLRKKAWDLVLLDRRLPDCDGLLLLQTIKDKCDCPVIILSVLDDEHDRTLGLGLGAQDYITKPFSATELSLRIRNLLLARNASPLPLPSREIEYGCFRLIQTTRRLIVSGVVHQLTLAETRLAAVFLTHPGEILDRNLLTQSICHREWSHNDRSIDVLVARLRKYLEPNPKFPRWIVTVHGAGYLFNPDADVDSSISP
ncbi:response regulator [Pelagibius sp. Alg239-R121]|uniref:response regulator n=1 Tax=Pelagibius sp. Alg239-R121 TaxID=2993448 RepID=UPI0024A6E4E4|nr:response regulator transcription factor [Pelagibius sp. Alg239-R121]